MKSVTVSAPGKIHLMGEHAVVYGKPALLSAINLRLSVTVNSRPGLEGWEETGLIEDGIHIVQKALSVSNIEPIKVTISSDLPSGYHLGSSAALAVALTGALMQFYTGRFDLKEINDIAYRIEKIAHGNPSGGDNTTSTFGHFLWYRKEMEFLKLFSQLSLGHDQTMQNFFLIDTGKPESTKDMVSAVKILFKKNDRLKKNVLEANELATKKTVEALHTHNESMLLEAIREGEQTLEHMQVVSKKVQSLIREIESMGGAAKILGGGGKKDGVGYLLCYYHAPMSIKGKSPLEDVVSQHSYQLRRIQLGEEGVRLETNI